MFHVVPVRFAEPATFDNLAVLVRRQMVGRSGVACVEVSAQPETPSRSRAWDALARGLWRMAADAATDRAAPDRLPWTRAAAPVALLRELAPA